MTSFYGLKISVYTNTSKRQTEERIALPASFTGLDKWRGAFSVTLASAVLDVPIPGLYLDGPGDPGSIVGQADQEPDERGMFPLYAKGEWAEEPVPYAEVRELSTITWFPEGAFLSVPCAMLPREEQVPAGRSLPVASWGAPGGMAAWTFRLLGLLARLYVAHRAGDPKGYTPIMDAALAAMDRPIGEQRHEQWHERVKRAAAWALAEEMHKVLTGWRAGGLEEREAILERDGMLAIDAVFCELLRGIGAEGSALSEALQQQRRERRRTQAESWRGWDLWLTPDEKWGNKFYAPWNFPFLRYLADVLWVDRVCAAFEVERGRIAHEIALEEAPPLSDRLRVVEQNGARYSQIPKAGGATAWAWGGRGEVEDGAGVEGHGMIPALACLLPHGRSRSPSGRRPADVLLPVGFDDLEVGLVLPGNRQLVLTPTESKVLILMLATSREPQGVRVNLGELTRHLNPKKERVQARDYEETAKALEIIAAARIRLPDGTNIRMFDARIATLDGGRYEERVVSWVAGPHFYQLQRGQLEGAESLRALNGAFLANLDLIFSFSGNEAAELRAYIYACKLWNDARHDGAFDADKIRAHTLEQWAAATNMLSPATVEYLDSGKKMGSRQKLSDDKALAWKALEKLVEMGALTIEGDKRSFRPIPTADHVRAFGKHREGRASTLGYLGIDAR
jgi:hypothetical protein